MSCTFIYLANAYQVVTYNVTFDPELNVRIVYMTL